MGNIDMWHMVNCPPFTDMNRLQQPWPTARLKPPAPTSALASIPGPITGSILPGLDGRAADGPDTSAMRTPGEDVIQSHRERCVRNSATGEQSQSKVLIPGFKELVLSDLDKLGDLCFKDRGRPGRPNPVISLKCFSRSYIRSGPIGSMRKYDRYYHPMILGSGAHCREMNQTSQLKVLRITTNQRII